MWSEDHWENSGKMQSHSMVWATVWILALLVTVTVAAVGTYFYRYANRSDCQISLYDGQVEEASGFIRHSASKKNINSVIESRAVRYNGNQAKQQLEKSPFELKDSNEVWETETIIELFQTEYKNADGIVTVKSADGDAVIAPGTEGHYTFRLENTSNVPAEYAVWMNAKLNFDIIGIPIQMRIGSDSGWLLGDEDQWVDAEDLDDLAAEKIINAGKASEYTIYWQWPFEYENDVADTDFGDVSMEQGLSYTVTIHTLTTAVTEDNPPEGDSDSGENDFTEGDTLPDQESQKPSGETGKTGDETHILFWSIVFGVSFGILFLIFVLRKRKNDRKNEQNQ